MAPEKLHFSMVIKYGNLHEYERKRGRETNVDLCMKNNWDEVE